MQIQSKRLRKEEEIGLFSDARSEGIYSVINELHPLVVNHGIQKEVLARTFAESLLEVHKMSLGICDEEHRLQIIGFTLWKLFARGAAFWVSPKTEASNIVPLDILVAAYAVWKSATTIAAKNGIDALSAAEVLVHVAHNATNLTFRNRNDPANGEINDAYHYIFTAYTYTIRRIAARQRRIEMWSVDIGYLDAKQELSDQGVFWEIFDRTILCSELLNAMPAKGKMVAIARYVHGYEWPEVAEYLGTSINAAQKALSAGISKVFDLYRQDISRIADGKVSNINARQLKKKYARLRGFMSNAQQFDHHFDQLLRNANSRFSN